MAQILMTQRFFTAFRPCAGVSFLHLELRQPNV
jgi:hypothetical protein